jgi:hypothetical protein
MYMASSAAYDERSSVKWPKKEEKTESEIRTRAEMEINVNDGVVVVVRITTSIFMATIQGRMVNKKRETAFDQMTSE